MSYKPLRSERNLIQWANMFASNKTVKQICSLHQISDMETMTVETFQGAFLGPWELYLHSSQ